MADPKTRLPPDSTGTNRLDALHDPWLVVLFMSPGAKTTVRVNGRVDLHMSFAKAHVSPKWGGGACIRDREGPSKDLENAVCKPRGQARLNALEGSRFETASHVVPSVYM